MNSQFKLGDGSQINFEKSAEVVKYNGRTLKEVLDNLSGAETSSYGEQLLQAENLAELKRLLGVEQPLIYDKAAFARWTTTGDVAVTSTHAKYGQALAVNRTGQATSDPLTFGGNPFTVSLWAYIQAGSASEWNIFSARDISIQQYTKEYINFAAGGQSLGRNSIVFNNRFHLELGYNAGRVYYSINGVTDSFSATVTRKPRTVMLGGAVCWIDELQILDGVCLHTGTFTPPSTKYSLTEQTISLLHFDN